MSTLLPPDEEPTITAEKTRQDWLKEFLHYNPVTGEFIRLKCRFISFCQKPFKLVLHRTSNTYYLKIDGVRMPASNIAYCYMTGHYPTSKEYVMFVDGDKSNFKFDNLVLKTRSEVIHASKITGGKFGVRVTPAGRFQAVIYRNGKSKYLGTYNTEQEARISYLREKVTILKKVVASTTPP